MDILISNYLFPEYSRTLSKGEQPCNVGFLRPSQKGHIEKLHFAVVQLRRRNVPNLLLVWHPSHRRGGLNSLECFILFQALR